MLLRIFDTDTLDSLTISGGENSNTELTIVIVFIVFVVIFIFFLFKKSIGKKNSEIRNNEERRTPNESISTNNKSEAENVEPKATIRQEKNRANNQVAGKSEEKDKAIEAKGVDEKKLSVLKTALITRTEIIDARTPEKEEQSKEKYIGYNPINIFAQTEPLNYPYVLMPKPRSVIKFPRKGRSQRKGYKEEDFKKYVGKYFTNDYHIFDDRFILVRNSPNPFEPDFTLIDEKNGINIFLDVEIDEPYEGINDILKRKPTHYQQSDTNRNNAFKNRGWIVIRFAEMQVHQEPVSCCRFIADVLKSINPKYIVPHNLTEISKVASIRQWTREEAEQWSVEKYREKYLGITIFGSLTENSPLNNIQETELGKKIEEQVKDDEFIPVQSSIKASNDKLEKVYAAINSNKYLSFSIKNEKTIIKPIRMNESEMVAFCYVKNKERTFELYGIKDIEIKDSYYTLRVAGPTIGLDQITNAVNTAITYHKLIRMKYTRSAWENMLVDEETGELLIDRIEAEESIRTINNIQLAINALAQEEIEAYRLNSNYITAYCNKREERRTFRFDRIGEIEILDL